MLTLIIVLAAVISALHLRTLIMNADDHRVHLINKQEVNGAAWGISKLWNFLMEQYGVPFAQYCVSVIYSVYVRLTFFNLVRPKLHFTFAIIMKELKH